MNGVLHTFSLISLNASLIFRLWLAGRAGAAFSSGMAVTRPAPLSIDRRVTLFFDFIMASLLLSLETIWLMSGHRFSLDRAAHCDEVTSLHTSGRCLCAYFAALSVYGTRLHVTLFSYFCQIVLCRHGVFLCTADRCTCLDV